MSLTLLLRWKGESKEMLWSLLHAQAEWDQNKWISTFEIRHQVTWHSVYSTKWRKPTVSVEREYCLSGEEKKAYRCFLSFDSRKVVTQPTCYLCTITWNTVWNSVGRHVYVLGKSKDFTWAWVPPFLRALSAVFLLWSLPSSFSPVWERSWLNEDSGFCLEKKKPRVTFFIFWGDEEIQLHHSVT